jgi:hypothetical protein
MAETYSLFFTERVEGEAHPLEHEPLMTGLPHTTAWELAVGLNDSGFLHDGVEAHIVSEA